ncbi:MAG: VCBS repeat-containing protein [Ruminococcaceae bacterium]|nr:VCBS repeat-containing protein [Oscillospiraceae bacterium]
MLIKKIVCIVLTLAVLMSLCGCDLFTMETEQMLVPPALTGDMAPIQEALNKSVNGEYTLTYPSSGEYRSAVLLYDIDGDNAFEAFAFYSQLDGDINYMHLNVISNDGKQWKSVSDQKIAAGGVDCVDFADLNSDGKAEIIVGWEIYGTSEKQLAVYSLENNVISQRLVHEYTSFLCCDLDSNNESELFIHHFNVANSMNSAFLYTLDKDGAVQLSSCAMDKAVRSVATPVLSTLSSGQPAIYIDEVKSIGNITEVLFLEKGTLVNPLLDTETGENTKTLCMSNVSIADINADEIIEIPISEEMLSTVNEEPTKKVFYTKWCSYNGEGLTTQQTTLLNTADGYYLLVPEKWLGNIALTRDTQSRSRTIYAYDVAENTIGAPLAFYTVVSINRWNEFKENNKDIIEISRNSMYVFAGRVYKGESSLSITEQELKGMFFLY